MKSFLKLEMKRVFHSKRFWSVLWIGCTISILQFLIIAYPMSGTDSLFSRWSLDTVYEWGGIGTRYPHPWYEYWLGGEWYSLPSYLFCLLFPLLAVLTQGDSIVADKLSGYTKHMFLRGKREHYYTARFVSAFLSGGVAVIIPLLLNIVLCAATSPSVPSQAATGTALISARHMWSSLYFSHPLVYILLYLLIDFVYGGLFAAFATAVGTKTKNRFLTLILPFIFYLAVDIICISTQKWEYSPFNFLSPNQRVLNVSFYVILLEALMILVPTVALFLESAKWDETL